MEELMGKAGWKLYPFSVWPLASWGFQSYFHTHLCFSQSNLFTLSPVVSVLKLSLYSFCLETFVFIYFFISSGGLFLRSILKSHLPKGLVKTLGSCPTCLVLDGSCSKNVDLAFHMLTLRLLISPCPVLDFPHCQLFHVRISLLVT